MEKTGESTRQLKVAKEIQKVMAEVIRSKGMAAFGGALVSVSGVKVSPDLSVAKIYVSVFPSDKAEAVMGALEENSKALRGELGVCLLIVGHLREARGRREVERDIFVIDLLLDAAVLLHDEGVVAGGDEQHVEHTVLHQRLEGRVLQNHPAQSFFIHNLQSYKKS